MLYLRTYTGPQDLEFMRAIARADSDACLHVVDLPYRLSSWALDMPETTALWFDDAGRLAAWAVMQTPFWAVDYAIDPAAAPENMHRYALEWAEDAARRLLGGPGGRPCWFINAFAGQRARMRDLEASGYADQSSAPENPWSKVLLARPAGAPVEGASLPRGFTIRPLDGAREVDAYVALQREVFGTQNMTSGWRNRTLLQPGYRPELDLVVEAPGGSLAAFCVGWYDAHGPGGIPTGQVEPMGVGEQFRKLGLGRAVLAEQFRRMQAAGARVIQVETDNERGPALALYQAVGFQAVRQVLVYRKDFEQE